MRRKVIFYNGRFVIIVHYIASKSKGLYVWGYYGLMSPDARWPRSPVKVDWVRKSPCASFETLKWVGVQGVNVAEVVTPIPRKGGPGQKAPIPGRTDNRIGRT